MSTGGSDIDHSLVQDIELATRIERNNSKDSVQLESQIHSLTKQLNLQRIEKRFLENPPWKLTCDWKRIIDYFVPLFILLLIIIASSTRGKRTNENICEITSYMSEEYYNQLLANLTSNIASASDFVIIGIRNTSTDAISVANCYDLENDGVSEYEPVSFSWKVILSLIPFVCVFQGVLAYNFSSRYVAPFTLLITIFLGVFFFENEGWWVVKHTGLQNNIIQVFGLIFVTIIDRVFWTIFEYAFNVFTAFFFLRVLELWGIIDQMNIEFNRMAPTDNRKILLILFCFAIMIAVVAPGGSNFLIAGAIMIELNHKKYPNTSDSQVRDDYDIRIGAICLFGNGLTSAFNLVGVCIIAISNDILLLSVNDPGVSAKYAAKQIGKYFSSMFFIFSVVSPFIMAGIYNRKPSLIEKLKDMKPDFWPMLLCGFVYALMQLLSAWFIGPELVCLIAAGSALLAYYIFQQCSTFGVYMNGWPNFVKRKYMLPFILLVVLLCCIRLIPGLEDILESNDFLNPYVLNIHYFDYIFERHFSWLSHSGTSVFIVSMLTPFIVPYYSASKSKSLDDDDDDDIQSNIESDVEAKEHYTEKSMPNFNLMYKDFKEGLMKKKELEKVNRGMKKDQQKLDVIEQMDINLWEKRKYVLREALKKSIGEALPVMVAIGGYASIAKIMSKFNMTQSIAEAIVGWLSGAPAAYAAFIPIIGMLGSGLTGSTTTSNFLFGQLQVQTSIDLGLVSKNYNSVWEIAGAQILGATGGEIISPMNAVFSTLLLAGRFPESMLIKLVMKVFVVWMIGCILVSVIFIAPKGFID